MVVITECHDTKKRPESGDKKISCKKDPPYNPQPVIREGTGRRHSAGMVGAGAGLTSLTSDPTPSRELCQAACS